MGWTQCCLGQARGSVCSEVHHTTDYSAGKADHNPPPPVRVPRMPTTHQSPCDRIRNTGLPEHAPECRERLAPTEKKRSGANTCQRKGRFEGDRRRRSTLPGEDSKPPRRPGTGDRVKDLTRARPREVPWLPRGGFTDHGHSGVPGPALHRPHPFPN